MRAAASNLRPAPALSIERLTKRIGRLAIVSLYREVALHPKPGLVGPMDSGSHHDMTMATFYRSLSALRHYFPAIALAGACDPELGALQALGLEGERRMLTATGGINTHRGAIFNLGLLCAAAGRAISMRQSRAASALAGAVAKRWGEAIRASARAPRGDSHGCYAWQRYGVGGARAEAGGGFPNVVDAALPVYREILAQTRDPRRAALQALFTLIAHLDDSNLLWRGGHDGLALAKSLAAEFLHAGGVLSDSWLARVQEVHHRFVARQLSPGGSADLLAVTLFLHEVETSLDAVS